MKKIVNSIVKKYSWLFLIPLITSCLVGCSGGDSFDYTDTDYDGLYDTIDPNPKDNLYKTVYKDPVYETDTGLVDVVVDYRDFLYDEAPTFNSNIAQLGATIVYCTYDIEGCVFTNNKYNSEEQGIFQIFEQIGLKNISYMTVGFSDNPNDKCGLFIGNHKAVIDGKKYQFFITAIQGYTDKTGWASNFDVGDDSADFLEVFGESEDWENKKEAKGFSVTAKRANELIMQYIKDYKDKSFETYFFGCGHSRGGAVMNLIGTRISSHKEIKSLFYCYNTPLTTVENDKTILSSYKNIFSLICEEDLVSKVPLSAWGFTLYGNVLYFSHEKNAEYYKSIVNDDYPGKPTELINLALAFIKQIAPTRGSLYAYSPFDENTDVRVFKSLAAANEYIEEIKTKVGDSLLKRCIKTEVISNAKEGNYQVKTLIRPCSIALFVEDVAKELSSGEFSISILSDLIYKYYEVLKKYIHYLVEIINDQEIGILDILSFPQDMYRTHGQLATVVSAKFAKPIN